MICKVKQVAAGVGADPAAGNLYQPVRPGNPAAAYTATPNLADQAPLTDPKRVHELMSPADQTPASCQRQGTRQQRSAVVTHSDSGSNARTARSLPIRGISQRA